LETHGDVTKHFPTTQSVRGSHKWSTWVDSFLPRH